MENETKQILAKLDLIKSDLEYLKGHVKDVDLILTEDDIDSLKEAENDLKEKKTKRALSSLEFEDVKVKNIDKR